MVAFYELKAEKPKGETYNFDNLKGKVVLIVNTASKCGFTPQCKWMYGCFEDCIEIPTSRRIGRTS